MAESPESDSSSQDRQAERWLVQLRDGGPAQKAEARAQLSTIFEARGMTSEAVELLVANARAGYWSSELFDSLARLYRSLGNEYLAASAALEAARLRERGPRRPSQSTGPRSGQAPGQPGPSGQGGQHGPSARSQPRRGPTSPPAPSNQPLRGRWEQPLRVGGWVAFAGLVVAALAVAGLNPVAAVTYAVAAGALGLLLAGAPGLRKLLRVPTGPLGDGVLMFVALLLFLAAGALLPRGSDLLPTTAPPARTPGPLYLGTPTPLPGTSPSTPAQSIPPTSSPVASPAAQDAQGNEQPVLTPPAASTPVTTPVPAPSSTSIPSAVRTGDSGSMVRIASVGSEGVRLRPAPGSEEILKVLAEGTLLESLGEEQEDGGRQWRRVREPEGLVGWVAADFLAAEPATPTVVTAAPTATPVIQAAVVRPPPSSTPSQAPTSPPSTPATLSTLPPSTATEQPRPATAVPPMMQVAAAKPESAPPATQRPAPPPATAVPAAKPTAPIARTAPSGSDCPPSQPVKGNHSSSGEWIYHVPGGQFYRVTKPEACFATADDARRAGYRPSQR